MDHPTSPMRGAPPQDNHSPHSPSSDPRARGMDRYRQPPPPGYPAPTGYPHYPSYGGPPQNPYGPPPPHGYPSRGPPAGYPGPPPHQSPPYGYGYPPGPRSPYHYASGYEGAYPVPSSRQAAPYRSVGPPRQALPSQPMPPTLESSSPQKIGSSPSPKSSPNRPPRDTNGSSSAAQPSDHIEVERLRAAAAAELTHEEVKPIQSDFHFFVKENVARFRAIVEEEVRKSLKEDEQVDPFLVNSNLNSRLKTAWENLKNDQREAFMVKEEEDRRRFMEEDEIASRHCATLTARGKSPRTPEKNTANEERQESEKVRITILDRESSPNIKIEEKKREECEENSNKSTGETVDAKSRTENPTEAFAVESPKKRSSPPAENEEDKFDSPIKRNRQSTETSG